LRDVGKQIGPFRFIRIDLYRATSIQDETESGTAPGFSVQHVTYPQIDNATSRSAFAWNKEVKQTLSSDSDCNTDLSYEVGLASKRFISLRWTEFTYCHGAARGYSEI
jgi:hypothetical protein